MLEVALGVHRLQPGCDVGQQALEVALFHEVVAHRHRAELGHERDHSRVAGLTQRAQRDPREPVVVRSAHPARRVTLDWRSGSPVRSRSAVSSSA